MYMTFAYEAFLWLSLLHEFDEEGKRYFYLFQIRVVRYVGSTGDISESLQQEESWLCPIDITRVLELLQKFLSGRIQIFKNQDEDLFRYCVN